MTLKFNVRCTTCNSPLRPSFEDESHTNVPRTVETWLVQNDDGTYSFEIEATNEMYGFSCACSDVDVLHDANPSPNHIVELA